MSWVGAECDTCGADMADENTPDFMKNIRIKTGLTRRQIGKKLGYQYSTVKRYEYVEVSQVYWDRFIAFIREFYGATD